MKSILLCLESIHPPFSFFHDVMMRTKRIYQYLWNQNRSKYMVSDCLSFRTQFQVLQSNITYIHNRLFSRMAKSEIIKRETVVPEGGVVVTNNGEEYRYSKGCAQYSCKIPKSAIVSFQQTLRSALLVPSFLHRRKSVNVREVPIPIKKVKLSTKKIIICTFFFQHKFFEWIKQRTLGPQE